jgi:predicted  nucleic acid-binding Zn-ribbon protein
MALQDEDDIVEGIMAQVEALGPRLAALDAVRAAALKAIAQLKGGIEGDERKRAEVAERLADHKIRHEKSVAQLDVVKRMREATAAVAQVEMSKRVLTELETSLRDVSNRLSEARKVLADQDAALVRLDEEQAAARQAIETERHTLNGSLAAARASREQKAAALHQSLRGKYDKIRSRRRSQTLFALESGACGSCDTAIPVHRRQAMTVTGSIEICEACGVLIFAKE